MPDSHDEIGRELDGLEAELKRLEAEYKMFFAGRLPRPPWETRSRVTALVKRLDRTHIGSYGERFRFASLQSRFSKFVDLWDRGLRAREEGRSGPFAQPPTTVSPPPRKEDRVLCVTSLKDPLHEMDKLHSLYESLAEARREASQDVVPFHKFVELVRTQVGALKEKGSQEVAFRVAVKGGKVAFTARGVQGSGKTDE